MTNHMADAAPDTSHPAPRHLPFSAEEAERFDLEVEHELVHGPGTGLPANLSPADRTAWLERRKVYFLARKQLCLSHESKASLAHVNSLNDAINLTTRALAQPDT